MSGLPDPRPPAAVRAVLAVANLCRKRVRHVVQRSRVGVRNLRYRARWTRLGSAAWRTATFLSAPGETRRRQRLASQYEARRLRATMSADGGFCLLEPAHLGQIDGVLAACRDIFERKRAEEEAGATGVECDGDLKLRAAKRGHLRNLLSNDDLRQHPELVDFALSEDTLGLATQYLGMVPYLNRVDLLYSTPRPGDDKVSSQLYHVDPEGLSQVKIFINVNDVGEAEGPLTFLPADRTARVISDVRALRRRHGKQHTGRYLDDEVTAVGAGSAAVRVTGPTGSGVAVDTSRCLHMGSRVRDGRFRLCLYLQYCSTRERGNAFDVQRYAGDAVRGLAVGHSARSAGGAVAAPHQAGDLM